MQDRRRFTLAGFGVFDEAMRPVDVGSEINVVETFPGDIIVAEDTLPKLTADEQEAMGEATDDFNEFLDQRKRFELLDHHDWLQIEQAAAGCVSGISDEWPDLVKAIEKVRGRKLMRQSSAWLRGFCEALILSR